jgi:hypothetical protein
VADAYRFDDSGDMVMAPLIFERAFELARSGSCRSVEDVRKRLVAEKYELVDAHLSGPLIRRQLRKACRAARAQAVETAALAPAE